MTICQHEYRYGHDFAECENEAAEGDIYCYEHGGYDRYDEEDEDVA